MTLTRALQLSTLMVSKTIIPSWDAAGTDATRRRVVIDQVASLTDTSAIAWHHRLCVPGAS
jgi:dGTPase